MSILGKKIISRLDLHKRKGLQKKLYTAGYWVLETFLYSWLQPLEQAYYNTKRIIKWLPVLWKDREWDYEYLFDVLKFKIKLMKEHHEKERLFVGVDKVIKQLHTCEVLLDRMSKNSYADKAYQLHDKKWNSQFEDDKDWDKFLEKINRTHLTEEQKKQEHKDFKLIAEYEKYMYNQDINYLFNIIKKYHQKWWS